MNRTPARAAKRKLRQLQRLRRVIAPRRSTRRNVNGVWRLTDHDLRVLAMRWMLSRWPNYYRVHVDERDSS